MIGLMPQVITRPSPRAYFLGTYADNTTNVASRTASFTAPVAGLLVVLAHTWGSDNRTVTSLSIGGTNGTIHLSNASAQQKFAIASRQVAAGAHSCVWTLSGITGWDAYSTWGMGAYLLTGLKSDTPATAQHAYAAAVTSRAVTLTTPLEGISLYQLAVEQPTVTWSSATEDGEAISAYPRFKYASKKYPNQAGSVTETATFTSAKAQLIGGVWR